MQARLTMKPEQEVIAAIQALDLESVKLRMMDEELGEGWTREYAERIETAYKTYLTMVVKHQDDAEDILLSKDVDEFWHTHILQTAKYMQDCGNMFGTYLHHNPHVGERTPADLAKREAMAEKTRSLYVSEFGFEHAGAQWAGQAIDAEQAAYSAATIREPASAYSAARIGPSRAAYSAVAIDGERAAYSAANIRAQQAAYSAANIKPQAAAYSTASIEPQRAAYSAANIRAQQAAYSAANIRPQAAAYSAASIEPQRAAYSAAAIRTQAAAYSAASIGADRAAYSAARIGV